MGKTYLNYNANMLDLFCLEWQLFDIFYLPFDLLAEVLLLCKKDYQRSLVSFVKDAKKQMLPAVLTL